MHKSLRQLCVAAIAVSALGAASLTSRSVAAQTQQIQPGQVLISELRFRGPNGQRDEFVELYNNTDQDVFVQASDASAGWAVVTSGQVNQSTVTGPVCTIPNQTRIPARGHFLCANTDPDFQRGYSLAGYPGGHPSQTAPAGPSAAAAASPFSPTTPDRPFVVGDLPDGFGVALFSTQNGPNQNAATRLDAFGFTSSPALFREGGGFATVPRGDSQHTFFRDLSSGRPKDTGNNAVDFLLVSVSPDISTSLMGAPGPENTNSPVENNLIKDALLDPTRSSSQPPNRERNTTPVTNGDLGTVHLRRTFTNNTGRAVTRLRFRVVNITTLGNSNTCGASACADVRALTSTDARIIGFAPIRGVRLEEPPGQPLGGGFNASLSADFITLSTPLEVGEAINIQFTLGVMRGGGYRFFLSIEALTAPPAAVGE